MHKNFQSTYEFQNLNEYIYILIITYFNVRNHNNFSTKSLKRYSLNSKIIHIQRPVAYFFESRRDYFTKYKHESFCTRCSLKPQIRKSTSGEKQNIKKIAELLAIPMDETLRDPSIEPIRISSSSVNQMRNEKDETPLTLKCSPRNRNREQSILRNQNQHYVENQINQVKNNVPLKMFLQNKEISFIRRTRVSNYSSTYVLPVTRPKKNENKI